MEGSGLPGPEDETRQAEVQVAAYGWLGIPVHPTFLFFLPGFESPNQERLEALTLRAVAAVLVQETKADDFD